MNGRRGKQCSIGHAELRLRDLTAQDGELVPQHQQLDILHVQASPATNQRTKQSPDGEVETPKRCDTDIGALHGAAFRD